MTRTCLIVVVMCCGLALAACTSPATEPTIERSRSAASQPGPSHTAVLMATANAADVACSEVIDRLSEPDGNEVVLDAVALPARTQLAVHPSDEPGRLFAKHGLLVRGGAEVELLVPPGVAGRASIGWGNAGRMGTRVRVPGCADGQGWLVFAGGYEVDSPMCLPLVVRAGGREQQVRIPVGAGCPAA